MKAEISQSSTVFKNFWMYTDHVWHWRRRSTEPYTSSHPQANCKMSFRKYRETALSEMDSQRALLDSLMGVNRNHDREADKVQDYNDSRICKNYLLGLCPHGSPPSPSPSPHHTLLLETSLSTRRWILVLVLNSTPKSSKSLSRAMLKIFFIMKASSRRKSFSISTKQIRK